MGLRNSIGFAGILAVLLFPLLADGGDRPYPSPAAGNSRSGRPEVLFTFDDGPHPTRTQKILNTLAEHRVESLFFWVGNRVGNQSRLPIVNRTLAAGHLVGNHTVSHPHLCSISKRRARREIDRNQKIYTRLTGTAPLFFRAPYGDNCRTLRTLLAKRKMTHLHWDIDPQEWELNSTDETTNKVIRKLQRLRGRAVVLMHDTHIVTVRALPKILEWIEKVNKRRPPRRRIKIISPRDLLLEASPWLQFCGDLGEQTRGTLLKRLKDFAF